MLSTQRLTISLALRGLLVNKGRSFLTMLGIIIGIASVIVIMAVGAGAQSLITSSIKSVGSNMIGILPGKSDDNGPPASMFGIVITTLTYEDAKALADIPYLTAIAAYSRGFGELSAGNRSVDESFAGVTASYPQVENHQMKMGRFFTKEEEQSGKRVAVIGADLKDELFPAQNPLGEKIKIKDQSFTVIGVLERKGSAITGGSDKQAFVPLAVAQKILLGVRHLGLIRAKVDQEQNIPLAMENVKRLLRYRHNIKKDSDDDFSVRSLDQALTTFTTVTNSLSLFLAFIAAVSLIVGGIGIMNIMLMTVKERTREIGLRKAIGATPTQIQNQFTIESMVLTGIGGFLGIGFGILLAWLVAIVAQRLGYSWEFVISLLSILVSMIVSLVVGLVFGLYPARKAARLNPIEALRYE